MNENQTDLKKGVLTVAVDIYNTHTKTTLDGGGTASMWRAIEVMDAVCSDLKRLITEAASKKIHTQGGNFHETVISMTIDDCINQFNK
ncbi:MAG: hypothetical protein EBZ77_06890 [Chitinophagia bacterium]|nr:hypothetical protein [Chitinophagia bacterium]